VFLGEGEYELTPATDVERRHLGVVLGENATLPSLVDRFDTAVFLFTDGSGDELKSHASGAAAAPLADAVSAFEAHLKRQRKDYRTNFHVRLLEDLHDQGAGLFLAFFKGKKLPPVLAGYDPLGAQRLGLLPIEMGGEESFLYVQDDVKGGFWYLSPSVAKAQRKIPSKDRPAAHAFHYEVDTRVEPGARLRGETTIHLVGLRPFRALRVQLEARLRVEEAALAPAEGDRAFTEIPFVQEKWDEDADLEVLFPEAVAPGRRLLLRLRYAGKDVLKDAGEGNFVVQARQSWYANLGSFTDLATYALTYRVPKANQVISVGEKVEERLDGEARLSRFEAKEPIRVAGFNYGVFKERTRKDADGGMEVVVYTNPGTPDVIHQINEYLRSRGNSGVGDVQADLSGFQHLNPNTGMTAMSVDTEQLAESALVDGVNACRVYRKTFGPIPATRVAVTQQAQWSFGQSWPSLVFLPYLAFLDAGVRHELGLARSQDFVDLVGYHEMAHQWWGHSVGFASYHDAWLSEGFAEFSAALTLQHTAGMNAYRRFFGNARDAILRKRTGFVPSEAGPLALGFRLETSRTPGAYQALVYEKGAFVLHMLRMLMQQPGTAAPDADFEALMRDFASRYAGKNPTTADFKAVVEKHMTPPMNATQDGKIDWFFDQWVTGTEIPGITSKLEVKETSKGKYRVSGTVTQAGVSKEFRTLVPLYLEMPNGRLLRFGVAPLVGEKALPVSVELELKEKPKRALANALFDVLAH
jgi:hypothetical protein